MIISHAHKYVYIGIPRTGSKSMNHWLMEHFQGQWHGGHHDYRVPPEASGYFIFTIVRNPYDRTASGHFAVTWDDQAPTEQELGECKDAQERLRRFRALLETRPKEQRRIQKSAAIPLDERIRQAKAANDSEGHDINQNRFVQRAGVNLALHFERLPQCLTELPFVDRATLPPLPHHPERGIRPDGNFFDFFSSADDEQVVWAHAAEDFQAFGYRRFHCDLPANAPDAVWVNPTN